jgi:nickel-type superoxide dismutase maturation protease
MLPAVKPGDHLLVDPAAYTAHPPEPGDIVVAAHPYVSDTVLIKRVHSVHDGRIFLSSDNPDEGTDSRSFGTIQTGSLLGRVVTRIST